MKLVLIIEDNEDNRVSMTILLKSGGFEVIDAETGRAGYQKALDTKPDLILLDIQLPDVSGTEVLQWLKENETTRTIPVIAVTSYAMSGDRQYLLNSGCNGYIEKPIDPDRVIGQIQDFLDNLS